MKGKREERGKRVEVGEREKRVKEKRLGIKLNRHHVAIGAKKQYARHLCGRWSKSVSSAHQLLGGEGRTVARVTRARHVPHAHGAGHAWWAIRSLVSLLLR